MIIRKPGDRPRGRHARRNAAARAARDRNLARYVLLDCGHFITREMMEAAAAFQPAPARFWCERCRSWRRKAPDPPAPELPDTPRF